jgi:hypothetical protein
MFIAVTGKNNKRLVIMQHLYTNLLNVFSQVVWYKNKYCNGIKAMFAVKVYGNLYSTIVYCYLVYNNETQLTYSHVITWILKARIKKDATNKRSISNFYENT